MKKLILLGLTFVSFSAHADFSSTVTAASNYIWRGQSFSLSGVGTEASEGSPVIQGTIDYAHSSGLGIGVFAGNSDSTDFSGNTATVVADTETDININYSYQFNDKVTAGAYAFWYNYIKNPSNNSMEYIIYVTYDFLRLDITHMPTFFGIESSSNYYKLSYKQKLDEKFGILAHYGRTTFEDTDLIGYKDYADYRAGFFFEAKPMTVEIAYTDTDRKDLSDKELNDRAVTIGATFAF